MQVQRISQLEHELSWNCYPSVALDWANDSWPKVKTSVNIVITCILGLETLEDSLDVYITVLLASCALGQ